MTLCLSDRLNCQLRSSSSPTECPNKYWTSYTKLTTYFLRLLGHSVTGPKGSEHLCNTSYRQGSVVYFYNPQTFGLSRPDIDDVALGPKNLYSDLWSRLFPWLHTKRLTVDTSAHKSVSVLFPGRCVVESAASHSTRPLPSPRSVLLRKPPRMNVPYSDWESEL